MAPIQRSDLRESKSLGDGDYGCIGASEVHSGAPEALGEQVIVIAAEIVAAAGEGSEP